MNETGYYIIAGTFPGGAERQANLRLLADRAREYAERSFGSLYGFIQYIETVKKNQVDIPQATLLSENDNVVRIMTIHKSKGLEFPVTFIAGASTPLKSSSKSRIMFSDNFGIAMKFKDDTGLALVENPPRKLLKNYLDGCEYEEELRVLYVALTRARERLYIYGTVSAGGAEEYIEEMNELSAILSPHLAKNARSLLDIIMTGKTIGKTFIDLPKDIGIEIDTEADAESEEAEDTADTDEGYPEVCAEEYIRRFEYEYPLKALESLPEKISISKLTPTVLDGAEESEMTLEELLKLEGISFADGEELGEDALCEGEEPTAKEKRATLPAFMSGSSTDESAKRGIATHNVLQFCDFKRLQTEGAEKELKRLVDEGYISEKDAKRVRIPEIERFIGSELFGEMTAAKKLYRELRFNIKLPAGSFTSNPETKEALKGREVLVQGVIDCIIEHHDGSLHLIDYKTDRLSRAELQDEKLANARLRAAHTLQLSYYGEAILRMFGRAPIKTGIYSLHLGKEVEITESAQM
jgi:ATP-dependent helicase/nuclease subunit A